MSDGRFESAKPYASAEDTIEASGSETAMAAIAAASNLLESSGAYKKPEFKLHFDNEPANLDPGGRERFAVKCARAGMLTSPLVGAALGFGVAGPYGALFGLTAPVLSFCVFEGFGLAAYRVCGGKNSDRNFFLGYNKKAMDTKQHVEVDPVTGRRLSRELKYYNGKIELEKFDPVTGDSISNHEFFPGGMEVHWYRPVDKTGMPNYFYKELRTRQYEEVDPETGRRIEHEIYKDGSSVHTVRPPLERAGS